MRKKAFQDRRPGLFRNSGIHEFGGCRAVQQDIYDGIDAYMALGPNVGTAEVIDHIAHLGPCLVFPQAILRK